MVGHFGFHSRCNPKCFVDTSEVIVHEVDSNSVVFNSPENAPNPFVDISLSANDIMDINRSVV